MIAKIERHKLLNNKTKTKHKTPIHTQWEQQYTMNQQQQGQRCITDISLSHYGSLNAFYWYQIFVLDFVVVKTHVQLAHTLRAIVMYCHRETI